MKTTFTKTELNELLSIAQAEIKELKADNSILNRENKRMHEERDDLFNNIRQLKSREELMRSKISRLRLTVGSQEDYIDDIIWFGWNFPYHGGTFIDDVWEGDGSLINHIQDKFSFRMNQDKKNGFFTFISDLDEGNRHKLYEWIVKNYSKKGRVRHTEEA